MGPVLDVVTGWTLYAGLTAALGGCAARWFVAPRAAGGLEGGMDAAVGLERSSGRLAFAGSLLLLPAMALFFVRQLVEFRDPFVPWTEDAELLLTGTAWGSTWIVGAVGAVAAVCLFALVLRGVRAAWWPATLMALALGSFPAFTGHASGGEGPRALLITADVLHVWAAACWIGGLTFVLYAERRRGGTVAAASAAPEADAGAAAGPSSLLPALVPAFSPLAIACVTVLAVSGTFAAWVHLPDVAALPSSTYGRTLLLKLALVGAAFGLGFVNWRRLTPRLASDGGRDALRRAATVELIVVQAVLVVTAMLVRTPPPMG